MGRQSGGEIQFDDLPFFPIGMMRSDNDSPQTWIENSNGCCGRTVQTMKRHPVTPDGGPSLNDNQRTTRDFRKWWKRIIRCDWLFNADSIENHLGHPDCPVLR